MIKKIVKEILDEIMEDWDDEENKKKVQERFLDPMICYIMDKLYPYFIISTVIVFILVFLSVLILYFMIHLRKKVMIKLLNLEE